MIGAVIRLSWLALKRDRVAQGLSFVLPIIFFSIFALVFGGAGGDGTDSVRLVLVDEDSSEASRRFAEGLSNDQALYVLRYVDSERTTLHTRDTALSKVKSGGAPVAVIIPKGFGESFGDFFGGNGAGVELHADTSDPVAPQMVAGLMQKAAMIAAPDLMMKRGIEMLEKFGGPLTAPQRLAVDAFAPLLRGAASAANPDSPAADGAGAEPDKPEAAAGPAFSGPVEVTFFDVLGESKKSGMIAFYAAGTAVMFLLFSMSGAGGALLEEHESGVLERLLSSHLTMGQLLMGKWLFLTIMGSVQVLIMFVWGWLVFKLELFTPVHFTGFVVMTAVTAASAAAFGLVLATACRTQAQLGGTSTIVILIMSAVGGSMFPRFLMPDLMQQIGLITFNAWALDGYQKIFWYDQPVWSLGRQLGVLAGLTVAFLLVARRLARRWEAA